MLVGLYNPKTPLQDVDTAYFRQTMTINLDANFCKSLLSP